jgi:hypothetical protein
VKERVSSVYIQHAFIGVFRDLLWVLWKVRTKTQTLS